MIALTIIKIMFLYNNFNLKKFKKNVLFWNFLVKNKKNTKTYIVVK